MKFYFSAILVLLLTTKASLETEPLTTESNGPPFLDSASNTWADSVFNSLSLDEKIAQLFMVAAYSNRTPEHEQEIRSLIQTYNIGGLIFFQGGPQRQVKLTNQYQSMAKTPLMIGMDAEWGLSMRLDSVPDFPKQMTLGAIRDQSKIYAMGKEVAKQLKRMGVHVNFAPVVDVNNNSQNPVINYRSFGENKYRVVDGSAAYMQGLQEQHLLACAKHFPGHGDTDADSHHTLPSLLHSRERMDSLELYPFKQLIQRGLGSVMVAHLNVPSLDSTRGVASTLSKKIVSELLQKELGFQGLIFTDALNMKGVANYNQPGELELKALMAGNDILLFSEDVPLAIEKIKQAVEKGHVSEKEIDKRCLKLLKAKAWVGLAQKADTIEANDLFQDLNAASIRLLNKRLVESALTLLQNEEEFIPLKNIAKKKIAVLSIGAEKSNTFQHTLEKYKAVSLFSCETAPNSETQRKLISQLKSYDLVLVSIHGKTGSPKQNFGVTQQAVTLVKKLNQNAKVLLTLFASPYALSKFYGAEKLAGLLVAYENNAVTQAAAAQAIFGAEAIEGVLPVTASSFFQEGDGLVTSGGQRLKFTVPEEVGIISSDLDSIDWIVKEGIEQQAYPGCQVLIAKEGKVIYNKTFGYHTYEELIPVNEDDLYDLASITKIVASTAALMKLQDEGKFSLEKNLCDYLPNLVDTTDYININLREMLAHQAGFAAWIPFFQQTMQKGQLKYDLYSVERSKVYATQVAENLYLNKNYADSILSKILTTRIRTEKEYQYSDLGFYFVKAIVEKLSGMPLEEYVSKNFYTPMELTTMGYHPRDRFDLDRIVPTEYDLLFRRQLVHGFVHDPGAAMLGGVGGHAGVFSNATDLAAMMQMFLNEGTYGGKRYLNAQTVREYTSCQFCLSENRRGAGFDKPVREEGPGPTCDCVSFESYGHSGFTGTLAWADPDEEVIYIFLSNRVYPNAGNRKLIKMSTRTRIQEAIYRAIALSKERSISGS